MPIRSYRAKTVKNHGRKNKKVPPDPLKNYERQGSGSTVGQKDWKTAGEPVTIVRNLTAAKKLVRA
jgi:hypothetical protein